MYNGLTTADKGALLDAKARGAEWVARDTNNDLYGFAVDPIDDIVYGWTTPFIGNVITINAESMKFVAFHEKANIDLALAQIAEMEKAKPDGCEFCVKHSEISGFSIDGEFLVDHSDYGDNSSLLIYFCPICGRNLNSPYTEGETK